MINKFIERWEANKASLDKKYSESHPSNYKEIVRDVVSLVSLEKEYGDMDPDRIHCINDGSYQGTLLFIIAGIGYQPSDYWHVMVHYGSCSGCDTLQGISHYSSEPPTKEQTKDYMTLALHILQRLKKLDDTTS